MAPFAEPVPSATPETSAAGSSSAKEVRHDSIHDARRKHTRTRTPSVGERRHAGQGPAVGKEIRGAGCRQGDTARSQGSVRVPRRRHNGRDRSVRHPHLRGGTRRHRRRQRFDSRSLPGSWSTTNLPGRGISTPRATDPWSRRLPGRTPWVIPGRWTCLDTGACCAPPGVSCSIPCSRSCFRHSASSAATSSDRTSDSAPACPAGADCRC